MKKIYILLLTSFLIYGCNVGTFGTYKNDDISLELRNEIEKLDKQLLNAIKSNDVKSVQEIMSPQALGKKDIKLDFEKFFKSLQEYVKDENYTILDQYYVKNSSTGISNTLISGKNDINDYKIQYIASSQEMFTSLILVEAFEEKMLITTVYGKYSDGWKMNIFYASGYTSTNKTAPELYEISKKELEKGYLINAANPMLLSTQLLNPVGEHFEYNKKSEIMAHFEKIKREMKIAYPLPFIIENLSTKPSIFDISVQPAKDVYYPVFKYITKVNLEDTVALKLENDKMHVIMKDIFKGLDKGNEHILYKAYNQFPNANGVDNYGFVREY